MTEKILKISDAIILFAAGAAVAMPVLFPVFLSPSLSVVYNTIIIFAGFVFIMSNKLLKEENKIETPIDQYLFLLVAWHIVSLLFAENRPLSLNTVLTFVIFILFYYIVYNYAKKYSERFIYILLFLSALLGIYGIFQYFFGFDITLKSLSPSHQENFDAIKSRLESGRIFSTLIYPNTYAGFLILVIPVAFGFLKNEKKLRPYLIPLVILLVINLLLTRSIGGILSLFVSVLVVSLFLKDPALKSFKKHLFAGLALLALVFAAVIVLRGSSHILPDLKGRLSAYLNMLDVAVNYFLTGAGPGGFETAYNTPGFKDAPYLKHAHNVILQAAVELGLPGLILILAAVASSYRAIIQNFYFARDPRKKILIVSLLAGITAFLIHNLVDFDIYNYEMGLVFLFVLAILMSQVTIGLIQLKKIKLTYLLGVNPGKRRRIIFGIISGILILSAITAGKHIVVTTAINILVVAGFAMWSVSKEDIRRTALDLPFMLILTWFGLSLFITPYIYEGSKYFLMVLSAVIIFYLSSQFLRRHIYRIIISNIIIWTGVLLSFAGAAQAAYRYLSGGAFYADGFFPNQGIFAGYLAIPFSMVLSRLLFEKKIRYMWLKISALLVLIGAESIAASKSGMAAMLFVFISTWIYYRLKSADVKDAAKTTLLKSRILKAFVVVFLVLIFGNITPSGKRITNISSDPYYFNRAEIYKTTLKMAAARPLTGHGLGSYERIFPGYNFPVNSVARYHNEARFAHNEFLHIAAVSGITGLALFIFLLFRLFKTPPSYEGHRKLLTAENGAYFGLLGIGLHSLFYFDFHVPGILFTCAVLASIISREKFSIKTVSKKSLLFTKIYFFPALLLAIILFITAIKPLAAHLLYTTYEKNGSFHSLQDASIMEPFNSRYSFEKGVYYESINNYPAAAASYIAALRYDRQNYIYRLHAARCFALLHDTEKTLYHYGLALKANPFRCFTYAELSSYYYLELDNRAKSKELLLTAVELEPNYLEARNNLALIYKQEKDYKNSLKQFDAAEETIESAIPISDYEKKMLEFPEYALYLNKASLLRDMEKYPESCYYYKKSYTLKKDSAASAALKELCERFGYDECCGK